MTKRRTAGKRYRSYEISVGDEGPVERYSKPYRTAHTHFSHGCLGGKRERETKTK